MRTRSADIIIQIYGTRDAIYDACVGGRRGDHESTTEP